MPVFRAVFLQRRCEPHGLFDGANRLTEDEFVVYLPRKGIGSIIEKGTLAHVVVLVTSPR